MKITDVKVLMLSCPIPEDKRWRSDFGVLTKLDAAVVIVETDEGIAGCGAAHGVPPVMKAIVENQLKPALTGEDPTRPEMLWEKMYAGSRFQLSLRDGRSYPIQGRRGDVICAISGVDIALWDIFGKSAGLPVYKLLGGGVRKGIRAYASGGWAPPERAGREAASYAAKGFKAVKMRVGGMDQPDLEVSVTRVRAVREAVGNGVEIMIDAHGSLGASDALWLARRVEEFDISWFEEPVSADDPAGLAEVRQRINMPVAAGESEFTRFGARRLLEERAVDVIQPDVGVAGGITECRRIAALASAWGVQYAPHVWFQAFIFAASLHLAASAPNCHIFEVCQAYNPLIFDLTEEPLPIRKDGFVEVPDRPGLGFTLRPDTEKAFPYRDGKSYGT